MPACAAHLAYAYELAGVKRDPAGVDWAKEAREAYAWAKANTRKTDEAAMDGSLRHPRAYAAACLFRLTGDPDYETQLAADTQWIKPDTLLQDEPAYGPFVYVLGGGKAPRRAELVERLRSATLHTADETVLASAAKRALRWGGNIYMPMLCGTADHAVCPGWCRGLHVDALFRTGACPALSRRPIYHVRLLPRL